MCYYLVALKANAFFCEVQDFTLINLLLKLASSASMFFQYSNIKMIYNTVCYCNPSVSSACCSKPVICKTQIFVTFYLCTQILADLLMQCL